MGRLVLVFEKVIGIKEIGKRRVGISGIGSDNTANGFAIWIQIPFTFSLLVIATLASFSPFSNR